MAAIVPVGVVLLVGSFTFASIAKYYRRKYERTSLESYPILSLSNDTSYLSTLFLSNDITLQQENQQQQQQQQPQDKSYSKFFVHDENERQVYYIEKDKFLHNVWFFVDSNSKTTLWTINLLKKKSATKPTADTTSYAIQNNNNNNNNDPTEEQQPSMKFLKYSTTNPKYDSFQILNREEQSQQILQPSQSTPPSIEYRWLFNSKYLEKIDFQQIDPLVKKPIHKRIALAVNLGSTAPAKKKKTFNYELIYNHKEIAPETLVLSAFLSILTQWKKVTKCDKALKEKVELWNLNRRKPFNVEETTDNQQQPEQQQQQQETSPSIAAANAALALSAPTINAHTEVQTIPKASKYSTSSKIKPVVLDLKSYERHSYINRHGSGSHNYRHSGGGGQHRAIHQSLRQRTNYYINKANQKIAKFLDNEVSG